MILEKKCRFTRFFAVFFIAGLVSLETSTLFAQETTQPESQKIIYTEKQNSMRIKADDIRLVEEKNDDGETTGYHLYVRKIPGVESILLTETTRDPAGKADNYAYRALEYNPINGDEIRYLDGQPLVSEGAKYSLIDSTAEKTDFLGQAFHIFIPLKVQFGYEWSRNGVVEIGKGTFINIRTFEKPYADYTGDYMDSPFMFNLETRKRAKPNPPAPEPEPPAPAETVVLTDDYNPVASQRFGELSDTVIYSKGPETIVDDILDVLDGIGDKNNLDVVFAIDATGSMKNDIETLKNELLPALLKEFENAESVRFGLLFYRDYGDNFNYKSLPVKFFGFTDNLTTFDKNLKSIKINGKEGGDIPEAVYEAIYSATEFYNWRLGVNRRIILIGDAEPHPKPRGSGKYSKEYVMGLAESKQISVKTILLPSD
ncbi:MAG: VWA domain-containing protein [Treponema sp.]|nr:VWA domain-containing protein [Treponema sp.]